MAFLDSTGFSGPSWLVQQEPGGGGLDAGRQRARPRQARGARVWGCTLGTGEACGRTKDVPLLHL